MRILILCFWAHGNCYYTAKFANALSEVPETEVHLVIPENFLFDLLSSRVHIRKLPFSASAKIGLKALLKTFAQIWKTCLIIRTLRPEWIHILWLHHVPAVTGRCFTRSRIAYTAHDPVLHSGESGRLRTLINRCLIQKSNVCFTHGNANVLIYKHSFPKGPPAVSIPHGEFGFWEKTENVVQEKMILFFGRIRPYKGLAVLLDAFDNTSAGDPDLRLCICGEGSIDSYRARISRMSHIEIINRFIGHGEIPHLFGRSLFVCLPYLEATQSGVIPMAFALGRTCIATNAGALTDVAIHQYNSLIVPPGDVPALSNAMSFLLYNDRERKRMEKNALLSARTADSLSWKKAAATVIETYRTIDMTPLER